MSNGNGKFIVKISELTPTQEIFDADILPIVQDGETKHITYQDYKKVRHENLYTFTSIQSGATMFDTWPIDEVRAAKYLITYEDNATQEVLMTEISVLNNGATAYYTEYGRLQSGPLTNEPDFFPYVNPNTNTIDVAVNTTSTDYTMKVRVSYMPALIGTIQQVLVPKTTLFPSSTLIP